MGVEMAMRSPAYRVVSKACSWASLGVVAARLIQPSCSNQALSSDKVAVICLFTIWVRPALAVCSVVPIE